jgi:hypothetical protein
MGRAIHCDMQAVGGKCSQFVLKFQPAHGCTASLCEHYQWQIDKVAQLLSISKNISARRAFSVLTLEIFRRRPRSFDLRFLRFLHLGKIDLTAQRKKQMSNSETRERGYVFGNLQIAFILFPHFRIPVKLIRVRRIHQHYAHHLIRIIRRELAYINSANRMTNQHI